MLAVEGSPAKRLPVPFTMEVTGPMAENQNENQESSDERPESIQEEQDRESDTEDGMEDEEDGTSTKD